MLPRAERLDKARREGVRARLVSHLRLSAVAAEEWLLAWEAAASDTPHDGGFWDDGYLWIQQQRESGRKRP